MWDCLWEPQRANSSVPLMEMPWLNQLVKTTEMQWEFLKLVKMLAQLMVR